jgi:GTPase Era involved in 16S rRNA processing
MSASEFTKLTASNGLTESIHLPTDFAIAVMSGRSELLKLINRPLSAAETVQVAHAMMVLMDTHRVLQVHAEQVAEQVEHLRGHAKGLLNKIDQIHDQACFRELIEDVD